MSTDKKAQASPGQSDSPPASAEFNEAEISRKLGSAFKLGAIFCIMYFVAALIATPEFAHIARIEIVGLPLAFYTGILVFVVGIVVTRMCLNLDKKD